jgi:hypothetical protein
MHWVVSLRRSLMMTNTLGYKLLMQIDPAAGVGGITSAMD